MNSLVHGLQRPSVPSYRWHDTQYHSIRRSSNSLRRSRCRKSDQPGDIAEQQEYQALLSDLLQLDARELRQRVILQRQQLNSSFLFWLSDLERKASGARKQQLSMLAAELVATREYLDYQESAHLLPSLASSLAYANYSSWRQEGGGQALDDVVPGVGLEQLYQLGEREELKLQAELRSGGGKQARAASTLDSFAADLPAYQGLARDAMARVRARLMGYDDDEQAAAELLEELLQQCSCREERATALPQAFTPPGLELTPAGSSSGSVQGFGSSSSGQAGGGYTLPSAMSAMGRVAGSSKSSSSSSSSSSEGTSSSGRFVCTTPDELLASIEQRRAQQAAGSSEAVVLPSGEPLAQVLAELAEDIEAYSSHVYSSRSRLDRLGGGRFRPL